MPEGTLDPPRLGRRGEGWFLLQLALMVLIGLSALSGVYWPDAVAGALVVVALVLILAALVLLVLAGFSLLLARSTTVFPRPREGARLAEGGVYRRVIDGPEIEVKGRVGWSVADSPLGLIPTAVLALVFDLKARVEESWLEERLPGYAAYRERTPRRFVPGLY